MHISDVHDYSMETPEVAKKFLTPERRKAIKDDINQVIDEEQDALEEHCGEFLSQLAAGRAEKFLEKVLAGDENAAASFFGCYASSRYRASGMDAGKPWANLIHNTLFETSVVALRRKIVEAHADLLRNERIKDLEATVEGLTIQVQKAQAEVERLRQERY